MNEWKNNLKRDKYNELAPDGIIETFEKRIKEEKESGNLELLTSLVENLKRVNGRLPPHIKDFLGEELLEKAKTNRDAKLGFLGVHFSVDDDDYTELLKTLINEDDLDADGYEIHPHITILFGFNPSVTKKDIKSVMEDKCIFHKDIEFSGLDVFETDDYDVIVVKIESEKLHNFHNFFEENFPNKQFYPDYKPHMTLAYVKKGLGKQYVSGFSGKDIMSGVVNHIKGKPLYYRFNSAEKEETLFSIICD